VNVPHVALKHSELNMIGSKVDHLTAM
jgi:hypothetical protein